jgi:hypothetical protein
MQRDSVKRYKIVIDSKIQNILLLEKKEQSSHIVLVAFTLVSGKEDSEMGMVSRNGLMEQNMKASGKMDMPMVMESSPMLTVTSMKVVG